MVRRRLLRLCRHDTRRNTERTKQVRSPLPPQLQESVLFAAGAGLQAQTGMVRLTRAERTSGCRSRAEDCSLLVQSNNLDEASSNGLPMSRRIVSSRRTTFGPSGLPCLTGQTSLFFNVPAPHCLPSCAPDSRSPYHLPPMPGTTLQDCNLFGGVSACKTLPSNASYLAQCPGADSKVRQNDTQAIEADAGRLHSASHRAAPIIHFTTSEPSANSCPKQLPQLLMLPLPRTPLPTTCRWTAPSTHRCCTTCTTARWTSCRWGCTAVQQQQPPRRPWWPSSCTQQHGIISGAWGSAKHP